MRRTIRLLSFAALLGAAVPAAHARTILAAVPISRMDLHWWRARFDAKQAELRARKPELIFLGDSITENWEKHGPPAWQNFAPVWQHYYGDRNAVNLGFIGDTTASLIWRIENGELAGISPKVAVVLIGANNLGHLHWSADDTVLGIQTILQQIHRRLPHTKVLLLSVLPSDRTAWATRTTRKINHMLAQRYGQDGGDVTFLDVTHVFEHDGKLDRDLFYDPKLHPPEAPLHPTAQGQALLAQAMELTLARLLGDHVHH